MRASYRSRRMITVILVIIATMISIFGHYEGDLFDIFSPAVVGVQESGNASGNGQNALTALSDLKIKGRAAKTGYSRDEFGGSWGQYGGCDMRNVILHRDLTEVKSSEDCLVLSGILSDPYTGETITFTRGADTSGAIQIDHVVAVSDAWQKGASYWTKEERVEYYNDPLVLLAVDGGANQQKGDGDAATWLPSNKAFRCQYIARQIAVKQKYDLWVTQAEHDAMSSILSKCPNQLLPTP